MEVKVRGIFIKSNTPSSKNSKQIVLHKIKGSDKMKRLIIHSKPTLKYKKQTKLEWLEQKRVFLNLTKDESLPLVVGFHLVRKSRHQFDFINILQIVQDLMVEYGWIKDDNMDSLIPIPFKMNGKYYTYNKENPGVYIVPITKELLKNVDNQLNND